MWRDGGVGRHLVAGSILALGTLATTALAQSTPVMEDLGDLGFGGDPLTFAEAISGDGTTVVGRSNREGGRERAFRWIDGARGGYDGTPGMYNIGSLGSFTIGTSQYDGSSWARDVNVDGTVIVGESLARMVDGSARMAVPHAFRWVEGGKGGVAGNPEMQDLGLLGGGEFGDDWEEWWQYYSHAYGVNADGTVVVGMSSTDFGRDHAFRWVEGATGGVRGNPQMYDLGAFDGFGRTQFLSAAHAVNADGTVVVGESEVSWRDTHAFRWVEGATDGVESNPQMHDLGTLHGGSSSAMDVNADGTVVVGTSGTRAFRWVQGATGGVATNPEMQDLGSLGGGWSEATGVSDDGTVVVGFSTKEKRVRFRAFRWVENGTDGGERNPQMQDLGTLDGDKHSRATGVSGDGSLVVGYSIDEDYDRRAFIWRDGTMLDHEYTVTEVLDAVAGQMGAMELRNALVAGGLGQEVGVDAPFAFGRVSTKGTAGAAPLPLGLRLETGAIADGSGETGVAGLVVGAAVMPGLSLGVHVSRGIDGPRRDGFRFTGPNDTFGGYVRGGDRYDGLSWKLAVAGSGGLARISRPGALADTEAGAGDARVSTLSARLEASYALRVTERIVVAPLIRLGHVRTARAAYAEDNGVSFPIRYDAASSAVKTLSLGIDTVHALGARLTLRGEAGVEADLARRGSAIRGESAIPGLTDFAFDPAPASHPVRVHLGAGARYALGPNRAVTVDTGLRQNAFTGGLAVRGSLGYEVRF